MVDLKKYGFEQIGKCWVLREGIYILMHSKKTSFSWFGNRTMIDVLELYMENKDGEMILLGEIEGEESLKTILNLIKK